MRSLKCCREVNIETVFFQIFPRWRVYSCSHETLAKPRTCADFSIHQQVVAFHGTTWDTLWKFGGKSRASHGNSPVFPHFWLELQGKFEENVAQKYNFSYLINFSQVYQEDYAYPSICELSSWFLIPHGESACTARTNLCTRCTDQCFHFRWQILYRKNYIQNYKITFSTGELFGT